MRNGLAVFVFAVLCFGFTSDKNSAADSNLLLGKWDRFKWTAGDKVFPKGRGEAKEFYYVFKNDTAFDMIYVGQSDTVQHINPGRYTSAFDHKSLVLYYHDDHPRYHIIEKLTADTLVLTVPVDSVHKTLSRTEYFVKVR